MRYVCFCVLLITGCWRTANSRNHVKMDNDYRYQVMDSRSRYFYTDAVKWGNGCVSFTDENNDTTLLCGNFTVEDRRPDAR